MQSGLSACIAFHGRIMLLRDFSVGSGRFFFGGIGVRVFWSHEDKNGGGPACLGGVKARGFLLSEKFLEE